MMRKHSTKLLKIIKEIISNHGRKTQHSCKRWALREPLTPLCDFACKGLKDDQKLILCEMILFA